MLTLEPGKPHVLQAHCDTAGQATMTFLCCKNLGSDLTTDMINDSWREPGSLVSLQLWLSFFYKTNYVPCRYFTKDDMFLDLDDSETRDDSESQKRVVAKCKSQATYCILPVRWRKKVQQQLLRADGYWKMRSGLIMISLSFLLVSSKT